MTPWGQPPATKATKATTIGGVAVEVLSAPVVDRRGAWVGVAGGDLDVAQGDAGVEGGHDERCAEHVGMYVANAGPESSAGVLGQLGAGGLRLCYATGDLRRGGG